MMTADLPCRPSPEQAGSRPGSERVRTPWIGAGILLCTALLYSGSLAPTLLWGDDAMFQRALATGVLTNHPVWGILARALARLPLGGMAFRANLISAVCATAAVGFLYLATRAAGGSPGGAAVAATTLAISHTFWLEAVRAEVYSLHMALFLAGLWALLEWRRRADRWLWLAVALTGWLLATVNHLLMTLALPGGAWLVWRSGNPADRGRFYAVLLALCATAVLAVGLVMPSLITDILRAASFIYTTFRVSPRWLLAHLAVGMYQFPLLIALAVPGFLKLWRNDRDLSLCFIGIALPTSLFAATHGILESYVFHLPSYALIALCIGLGADTLVGDWGLTRWLALAATVALQIGLYRVTPLVLERLAPQLIYARDLPGRPASEFFLWPPKRGYLGARDFSEATMRSLPPDALVMADWTPFAPLQFLQDVEGQRPDVLLVPADSSGMQLLRRYAGLRPVFLANDDPRYYPMTQIEEWFRVEPAGFVYQLHPLEPST